MRLLKLIFTAGFFAFCWVPLSQAEYGCRFVVNKRLSVDLDSADKKLSFRFTCQQDMSAVAASVYCLKAVSPPSYLVSLREDQGGIPSEQLLTSCGWVPRSQSWSTVLLNTVPLTAGKTYHLVLEFDANRGGYHPVGRIGGSNHASFLTTDVLNRIHPSEGTPDPARNTLFFGNGKWKVLDQEPVFAVHGRGFNSQGNPYDDPGVRPIHGNGSPKNKARQVLQGEVLHFRNGFTPQALVLRVKKQGHPTAPLNYQILKNEHVQHNVTLEFSGVVLAPGQAPSDWEWVTVGVKPPSGYFSFAPECWYIAFQTDSGRAVKKFPGCQDCYLLSDAGNSGGLAEAADLTFDSGAHLSRATRSLDGGSPLNWLDDFERDANVVVLGIDYLPSSFGGTSPTPIPTPLFLEDIAPGAVDK